MGESREEAGGRRRNGAEQIRGVMNIVIILIGSQKGPRAPGCFQGKGKRLREPSCCTGRCPLRFGCCALGSVGTSSNLARLWMSPLYGILSRDEVMISTAFLLFLVASRELPSFCLRNLRAVTVAPLWLLSLQAPALLFLCHTSSVLQRSLFCPTLPPMPLWISTQFSLFDSLFSILSSFYSLPLLLM